jgi:hypothetical protein
MKTADIQMKYSEPILSFIHYSIIDEKIAARTVLSQFSDAAKKALAGYAGRFMSELKKIYGAEMIGRWRHALQQAKKTDVGPDRVHENDWDLYTLASSESCRLDEEVLLRLAHRPGDALDFLFAFNTHREIIRELLPRLPDPEEAYLIARHINGETETPEGLTLLAASTAPESREAGYVLKNREFQGYSFSIYKESDDRYSFEFISRQESLKGKIIHVSIILPQGEPVILEELCSIDTRQYALSYSGSLPGEADIQPAVISMK